MNSNSKSNLKAKNSDNCGSAGSIIPFGTLARSSFAEFTWDFTKNLLVQYGSLQISPKFEREKERV